MNELKQSAGQQILLIDYQAETSKNTTFLLRLAGYEVTIVARLEEAINMLSVYSSRGGPAVILLNNLELTSGLKEKLALLTNRCRSSKVLLPQATSEDDSEHFFRFHAT